MTKKERNARAWRRIRKAVLEIQDALKEAGINDAPALAKKLLLFSGEAWKRLCYDPDQPTDSGL